METGSHRDPDCQQLLDRDTMVWSWDIYRPEVATHTASDVSPPRGADLSRLAPAIVVTAEFDPPRDEGEASATALRDAGVTVSAGRDALVPVDGGGAGEQRGGDRLDRGRAGGASVTRAP